MKIYLMVILLGFFIGPCFAADTPFTGTVDVLVIQDSKIVGRTSIVLNRQTGGGDSKEFKVDGFGVLHIGLTATKQNQKVRMYIDIRGQQRSAEWVQAEFVGGSVMPVPKVLGPSWNQRLRADAELGHAAFVQMSAIPNAEGGEPIGFTLRFTPIDSW